MSSVNLRYQAHLGVERMMNLRRSSEPTPFLPAYAKLWIASLDDPTLEVQAQYNPKELQIDKQIPWQQHNPIDNRGRGRAASPSNTRTPSSGRHNESEQSQLEYNSAPTRSMTISLLFDGYEEQVSVEPTVRILEQMTSVPDPPPPPPYEARPHHCVVAWGALQNGMRPFRCVIETFTTKYEMWDHMGMPLRATCTLKLQEVDKMSSSPVDRIAYHVRSRGRALQGMLKGELSSLAQIAVRLTGLGR